MASVMCVVEFLVVCEKCEEGIGWLMDVQKHGMNGSKKREKLVVCRATDCYRSVVAMTQ